MYNILTLNKISNTGLSQLDASKYSIADRCDNPDGILLRSFNMHEYDLPETLLAVGRAGAGVNNIPIDKCTEKGIVVFNTPGANANAVKELVIAGLLLASRDVIGGIKWASELESDTIAKDVEKGKSAFVGPEIAGKTLGVIGLGAIGVLVANAASALGMNVIGYDPFISVDAAWNVSKKVKKADTLAEIYANSDYITLHLPANDQTKKMINKDTIATMKDGVRILNFARAELVNPDDMKAALDAGKVAKYVCDFPNNDLNVYNNVICIPHLGASTPESEENCAVMAASELREYIENGNIINSVNMPNVQVAQETAHRVTVIHKNIPSMIGSITNKFGEEHINIENMSNSSRKEIAYTIVDTNDAMSEEVLKAIEAVEGVIKVRAVK